MSSILDVNTLYQNLLNLSLSEEEQEATTGALLLSRRHSACSSDLPCSSSSSSSNSGDPSPVWPLRSHWTPSGQQQPRPVGELGRRPPLRPDRSVSLIEGKALPPPPPGFPPLRLPPLATASTPSRYKTELCRTFSETGRCKYGSKCQFAHGPTELRSVNRHPKYKTELCHKFYLYGECPYGTRCHFVHHLDEAQGYRRSSSSSPQLLRQSISYSGVPTAHRSSPPLPSIPDPASFARAASVSPPPISTSDLLSPTFGHLNSDPLAFLSALGDSLPSTPISAGCCSCRCGKKTSLTSPFQTQHEYFPAAPEMPTSATGSTLPRTPSASSLSDPDCYSSDSSLSGSDSPVFEMQASSGTAGSPHRLPIFNRLSVSE